MHIHDVDVAVCTMERANALMNGMLSAAAALSTASSGGVGKDVMMAASAAALASLSCVVIDEIHMLGDPMR